MRNQGLSREQIEKLDSVWKAPGYIPTLIAVACAFGAWSLLLPVVPLGVLDAGGSKTLAGATTTAFMATTVITQVFTPRLLRVLGYNPVMVAAAFILGLPALGYLLGMSAGPALGFSALRGVGFGALTVAQSALVAELVPMRFLGKASGMLGVAIGFSQMVFLPLGLAISRTGLSFAGVYAIAAAVAVCSGLMCLSIPRIKAQPQEAPPINYDEDGTVLPRVATWKLVTVPALAICSVSMGYGAVSSFLPAAVEEVDAASGAVLAGVILSVAGGSAMAFRFVSGMVTDRKGMPGATMLPGQIMAGLGLLLMALVCLLGWSAWLLLVAAVLFGGGFGMVQNEALLSMFMRLPRSRVSDASAIWNASYDAGTGMGSFILGVVAGSFAYSGAFGAGVLIILCGMAITSADHVMGRHRITDYSNTRARLRQVPVARKTVRGARRIKQVAAHPVEVGKLLARTPPKPGWKKRS